MHDFVLNQLSTVKTELTTTCLQRPLYLEPTFHVYNIKLTMNYNHLSTKATIFIPSVVVLYRFDCIFQNVGRKKDSRNHLQNYGQFDQHFTHSFFVQKYSFVIAF